MSETLNIDLVDWKLDEDDYGKKILFTVEGEDVDSFGSLIDNCDWNEETHHRNVHGNRWKVDRTLAALDAIEREVGVKTDKSVLVPDESLVSLEIPRGDMWIKIKQMPTEVMEILESEMSYTKEYWDDNNKTMRTYEQNVIFDEGIPVGMKSRTKEVLDDLGVEYLFTDYREEPEWGQIDYEWNFPHELRTYQKKGLSRMMQGSCVIQWPTGAGKTVGALRTVHELGMPTLILVHQVDLLEQWVKEIREILGVSPGVIQGDRMEIRDITVAMVPTLHNRVEENDSFVLHDFDILITDECVHPDSKIRMADNTEKKIKNVEIGEEVMSYNEEKDIFEEKEVTNKFIEDMDRNWWKIVYDGPDGEDQLFVTPDHEVWTPDGWVETQNLSEGDIIKTYNEPLQYSCDGCGEKFDSHNSLGGHTVTAHNSELQKKKSQKRWENMSPEKRKEWMHKNLIEPREDGSWPESMKEMGKNREGEDNPLFYNMSREEAIEYLSERQTEWWGSLPERERKERIQTYIEAPKHRSDGEPTSLEKWIINLEIDDISFTGQSDFWVEDEEGPMNPDFKVSGERKVIEVGDTNYWHDEEDIENRIERLESIGYECLYIRDYEIENSPQDTKRKIKKFVYNHNVEVKEVKEVKHHDMGDKSYDLTVEDNHNYIAENMLVHNCHHLPADSWLDVALHVNAYYRFGLSATVEQLFSGEQRVKVIAGIGPNDIAISPEYLIENGFLAKPKFEWRYPKKVDGNFSNWQEAYTEGIVENNDRNELIQKEMEMLLKDGYRGLVDVKRISHGEDLIDRFDSGLQREWWDPEEVSPEDYYEHDFNAMNVRERPIPIIHNGSEVIGYNEVGDMDMAIEMAIENTDKCVMWVSGEDDSEIREKILYHFRQGDIDALVSTLLREGVDVPELDAVVLAGGGKSATQLIQTIGRSLRPQGRDEALVVDFKDVGPYIGNHTKERYEAMKGYYGDYCDEKPVGL